MAQSNQIKKNYDRQAERQQNVVSRKYSPTYQQKAFNNWVKAVLLNYYTRQMCNKVQEKLDLNRNNKRSKLLHILDVGCGRGQDIKKWRLTRSSYIVATDFSAQCIQEYVKRWEGAQTPFKLYTHVGDFTQPDLYSNLQHSFYDMVSAQFSFHYMFHNEKGLKQGLANIFSNLLIDGVFIATVPDSYTIMKLIKTKGVKNEDGYWIYGNKFFSMRFKDINFYQPYGNQYGFYLQGAVGSKNEQTNKIQYTPQWLMDLDNLQVLMKQQGVQFEQTMNFVDFYLKYREQYKHLFSKFDLNYQPDQHMSSDLWEIVHLYRVLICRKVSKGKQIQDFGLGQRQRSIKQNHKRKTQINQFDTYDTSDKRNYGNRQRDYNNRNNHHFRGGRYERNNDRNDRNDNSYRNNYSSHHHNNYHHSYNNERNHDYSRSRNKKY